MSKLLISLKGISKSYGSKRVLKNVSFDIYQGEIFSLLGVNGAGKTTLSSIIATLHPATSGSLLWNGQSVYNQLLDYRRIVGFCPQSPNLNNELTVEQTLTYAGRYFGMSETAIAERREELLQKLHLEEYRTSTPGILSGGYRQRFLIARTLMHKPRLVILDEPTVGLDPQIRQNLWLQITALKNEGVSVLLTTHYLEEAELLSDRVCVIDQGCVKEIDSPAQLKARFQKSNLEQVFLHLMQGEE